MAGTQNTPSKFVAASVAPVSAAHAVGSNSSAPAFEAPETPTAFRRGYRLRRLLFVADIAALTVAFGLAQIYGGLVKEAPAFTERDLALMGLGLPLWVLFAHGYGLYHVNSRRADHGFAEELGSVLQMTTLWSWCALLVWELSGMGPVVVTKLMLFWFSATALLLAGRALARAWARKRTWYLQNALLVAEGEQAAASMVRRILRHPEYGINVVACLDTASRLGTSKRRRLAHVPVLHDRTDLVEIIGQWDIERVIFCSPSSPNSSGHRGELIGQVAQLDVHVDVVPSWGDFVGARLDVHAMEGMPLITVPYAKLSSSALVVKRALDVIVSAAALVVLGPMLALVALAIKLDSRGPVLFRQRRVGRNGRCFEVYKFRSMYVDAEERKAEVARLNFHGGGNEAGMFKIREDPRVTRIGRQIRRLSIDELPQLVNVLKGDMSLVGPRPLIETEDSQVLGRFRHRLSLTPGLTGLWQVNGRSEIPFEEMVGLDYLYVTSWSLWGDVKLLLKTVSVVLHGQGAY